LNLQPFRVSGTFQVLLGPLSGGGSYPEAVDGKSLRLSLVVIGSTALVWLVSTALPVASFGLAAGSAVAWCLWLDRQQTDP
jgi:hypothetical protein